MADFGIYDVMCHFLKAKGRGKIQGGGSNFPYIPLNEIQTMFSQLAKQSVRF